MKYGAVMLTSSKQGTYRRHSYSNLTFSKFSTSPISLVTAVASRWQIGVSFTHPLPYTFHENISSFDHQL
jgi:hypothetical protein